MLDHTSHGRRAGERGQSLILAIAFIAFFGLVVVSVLGVGSLTELQHVQTELTATSDSSAEGGAAYAAADAGRNQNDLSLTCAPGDGGQLIMQPKPGATPDSVGYTVNACNPGQTQSTGGGPGINCLLCILNLSRSPTAPTAQVLNLLCAQCTGADVTTTGGDDYINGSVTSRSTLTAGPSDAHVRLLSGAGLCSGCSPTPTYYAPAIADPLASLGAPSPPVTNMPSGCTSWKAANGCTENLAGDESTTVKPGLWASLTVSGEAAVTMAPGTYVFTGLLSVSGNQASLSGPSGVAIFLTCPGYGPSGGLCAATGHTTGGSVNLSGNKAQATFSAPTTGQYADIAVLADPHLLDPGGATACESGEGTCVYQTSGQGASVSGTIDLRSSGLSLQGNAGDTITGRLIANSLFMSVSGRIGSGLSLSSPGPPVSISACGVFDNSVTGTTGGVSATGRAIIQSQCGDGSLSGVVAFNYAP